MRKYKIELSEEQMKLVAFCLEDIGRFASGQCALNNTLNKVMNLNDVDYFQKRETIENHLKQISDILYPNAKLGYNGTPFIGNVYHVYRAILHRLAVDNNHNNVYSYPPLPSGDMGEVKISLCKQKVE